MPIHSLLLALALSLVTVTVIARPHEATPGVERAVAEQIAWVLSQFDDGADGLTGGEIETRFDETFLRLVPPGEVRATLRSRVAELGPLELVEVLPADANEHVAIYRAESGDTVMIGLAVDPATGRIAGFFLTPAPIPGDGATPEATPAG